MSIVISSPSWLYNVVQALYSCWSQLTSRSVNSTSVIGSLPWENAEAIGLEFIQEFEGFWFQKNFLQFFEELRNGMKFES